MGTRGCASLTPGYKPRLRLGLTCFACHRHNILSGVCDTPDTIVRRVVVIRVLCGRYFGVVALDPWVTLSLTHG